MYRYGDAIQKKLYRKSLSYRNVKFWYDSGDTIRALAHKVTPQKFILV